MFASVVEVESRICGMAFPQGAWSWDLYIGTCIGLVGRWKPDLYLGLHT